MKQISESNMSAIYRNLFFQMYQVQTELSLNDQLWQRKGTNQVFINAVILKNT